jgi:hypothetical protein
LYAAPRDRHRAAFALTQSRRPRWAQRARGLAPQRFEVDGGALCAPPRSKRGKRNRRGAARSGWRADAQGDSTSGAAGGDGTFEATRFQRPREALPTATRNRGRADATSGSAETPQNQSPASARLRAPKATRSRGSPHATSGAPRAIRCQSPTTSKPEPSRDRTRAGATRQPSPCQNRARAGATRQPSYQNRGSASAARVGARGAEHGAALAGREPPARAAAADARAPRARPRAG